MFAEICFAETFNVLLKYDMVKLVLLERYVGVATILLKHILIDIMQSIRNIFVCSNFEQTINQSKYVRGNTLWGSGCNLIAVKDCLVIPSHLSQQCQARDCGQGAR
jgi:hypothetical protein